MSLRIGELAKRAGISVRALHHYDALGLLRPGERSEGGYRLYGQADVMRLHTILTLKSFGCSLDEIRRALELGQAALPDILARQMAALDEAASRALTLRERMARILARMERHEATGMEDWLEALGMMHVLRGYLTEDELARLRRAGGRRGWREVAARVEAALAAGVAPDAPEGRELAGLVREMAREASGGDPVLAVKLRGMVRREERLRESAGFSPASLDWLDAALAAAGRESGPDAGRDAAGKSDALPVAAGNGPTAAGPTGTALGVATLRAAHQLLDDPPVFVDPLALAMVGPGREAAIRNDPARFDAGPLRGLRASVAVRSRFAEDAWARARARGLGQYVILGAGYDTFACRTPDRESRLFEVDHPATQARKRARLAEAGLQAPPNCAFVAVDFTVDSLAEALAAAGFAREEPAFFSWLGVTMYLPEATVYATVAGLSALAPGTELVFDYPVSPELLSPAERGGREAVMARAAKKGEPWRSAFEPATLAGRLAALGFSIAEDLGGPELSARYLAGRRDGLRKSGVTRLARVRRASRAG